MSRYHSSRRPTRGPPRGHQMGRVIDTHNEIGKARVRLVGSDRAMTVTVPHGTDVNVGDDILLSWAMRRGTQPTVLGGVRATSSHPYTPARDGGKAADVETPVNVQAFGMETGAVLVWDAPFTPTEKLFVVQENSTDSEIGAIQSIVTQGSYYLYNNTDLRYFRVCTLVVTEDGIWRSEWSSWVSAQALLLSADIYLEFEERMALHVEKGV